MKKDISKRVKPVTILWRSDPEYLDVHGDCVDIVMHLSVKDVKYALAMGDRMRKNGKHAQAYAEVMWVVDVHGTGHALRPSTILCADIVLNDIGDDGDYKVEEDYRVGEYEDNITYGLLYTDGYSVWLTCGTDGGAIVTESEFIPVRQFKAAAYAKPDKPRALRKSEKVKLDRQVQVMQQLRTCQQK